MIFNLSNICWYKAIIYITLRGPDAYLSHGTTDGAQPLCVT